MFMIFGLLLAMIVCCVVIAFAIVSGLLFIFVASSIAALACFRATRKIALVTAASATACAIAAALMAMTFHLFTDGELFEPSILIWSALALAWGGGVAALAAGAVAGLRGVLQLARSTESSRFLTHLRPRN